MGENQYFLISDGAVKSDLKEIHPRDGTRIIRKGQIVETLRQSRIRITENGAPGQIQHFDVDILDGGSQSQLNEVGGNLDFGNGRNPIFQSGAVLEIEIAGRSGLHRNSRLQQIRHAASHGNVICPNHGARQFDGPTRNVG